VLVDEDCEAARVAITFDAETSGGLLIAVAPEDAAQLEQAMQDRGVPAHRVGAVLERGAHAIELREGGAA
jgi:selenophosphate synthase